MTAIIALIVAALVLFFLEIFFPGGILAVIGMAMLGIAAYLVGSEYGMGMAVLVMLGALICAVALFFIEIRMLSTGPLAKYFLNRTEVEAVANKPSGSTDIVGGQGVTLTKLTPSGKVKVEGKTYEAATTGIALEQGVTVEVLRVEPFRIIVKKV